MVNLKIVMWDYQKPVPCLPGFTVQLVKVTHHNFSLSFLDVSH